MTNKNKLHCTLTCLFFILASTHAKYIPPDNLKAIAHHCQSETNVDPQIVATAITTQTISSDEKYKAYLVCSYIRQGYVDPKKAVILFDNIETFLSRFYNKKELNYTFKDCKDIKDDDQKELVFQTADCIINKLKEIDVIREEEQKLAAEKQELEDSLKKNIVENE